MWSHVQYAYMCICEDGHVCGSYLCMYLCVCVGASVDLKEQLTFCTTGST